MAISKKAKSLIDTLDDIKLAYQGKSLQYYTEDQRALALALVAQGLSYRQVCSLTGIKSSSTITNWVRHSEQCPDSTYNYELHALAEQAKKRLADRQYLIATNILEEISNEDIEKASLYQKVTSHGILVDKARLMSNESTANYAVITHQAETLDDKLASIDQQIAKCRAKDKDLSDLLGE